MSTLTCSIRQPLDETEIGRERLGREARLARVSIAAHKRSMLTDLITVNNQAHVVAHCEGVTRALHFFVALRAISRALTADTQN